MAELKDSQGRLTAEQLVDLSQTYAIPLGRNPRRTLLYYKSLGLITPKIVRIGPVRRAYYSEDDLGVLRAIHVLRERGLTLEQIREELREAVFLSPEGQAFLDRHQSRVPVTISGPGTPLTKVGLWFFIGAVRKLMDPDEGVLFLRRALCRRDGQPVFRY